jgi:transcription elongation factor Elf1
MKLYAENEAKVRAYNKTKNFKEETVACVTCNKTIPMNGTHYVAFGFYQCHDCGGKAAREMDMMMRGICPRCTPQIKDTVRRSSNTGKITCMKCGFSIRHHLPQDMKRVKRYRNRSQNWVL